MNSYIVLLRGINVGGHNKLSMEALRNLLTKNNFKNVSTYIQSGNIFLSSNETDTTLITNTVSALIEKHFNLKLTVLTILKTEIESCIQQNPYLKIEDDFKKLHVIFLSDIPNKELVNTIRDFKYKDDSFTIINRFIYLHYPNGSRGSKLNITFFEKKLNVRASARNWRTTLKLNELSV